MNPIRSAIVLSLIVATVGGVPPRSFGQQFLGITRRDIDPATGTAGVVTIDNGPLIHTAQILPWDTTGKIVGNGDPALQIEQVFDNLSEVLDAAGAGESNIVKLNVYLSQPELTPKVQAALAEKFKDGGQPAVCFVVGNLTEPDALVALDAVAVPTSRKDNRKVKRLRVPELTALKGAAAAILLSGSRYYVSGQAKNGKLPETAGGTLTNLNTTLTWLGLDKSNVVQLKIYLQPISAAGDVRAEVKKFFEPELAPPTVFVEWISPTITPVEIELIASDNKSAVMTGDSVSFLTPPALVLSKVFSRVAHVNHGKMIYFSAFSGKAENDAAGQLGDIFEALKNSLPDAGSDLEHLVKATYYVVDNDVSTRLNNIRPQYFNPERPPTASKAMVRSVGFPGRTVTVDMIGVTK